MYNAFNEGAIFTAVMRLFKHYGVEKVKEPERNEVMAFGCSSDPKYFI